jgi:periplasmic protein TonB
MAMNTEVLCKHWAGQLVDARFRLLQWLGSSGQSSVFLCEIEGNPEQKAAIKLFPVDSEGAEACAAGWTAAAGLYHPHLIQVLHSGRDRIEDTDLLYVVTEYAGEVLSEILGERPLTPDEVKAMLGPILDALAYLHLNGFVHTRVKPSNIMVVDDQLKLSAENIRSAAEFGRPPEILEIYDAPERAQGQVLPASDLWSLGVTLVESLTRIPPAWNRTSSDEPIVPPSIPEPFARITRECLRLNPALRCKLREVQTFLETGTAIPHRTSAAAATPAQSRRRRVAVMSACAAVLLAAFAIVITRSHSTHTPASSSAPQVSTSVPAPQPAPPSQQANATPPAKAAQQTTSPKTQPPATQSQAPEPATQPVPPQQSAPAPVSEPSAPTPEGLAAKGAVAQQVMPDVPQKASRTIEGTVKVSIQVNVDPGGAVSDASIDSQGPSRYFANLALQAAHGWRFSPAEIGGQAVASVWLLHFQFRQTGIQVIPVEQTP